MVAKFRRYPSDIIVGNVNDDFWSCDLTSSFDDFDLMNGHHLETILKERGHTFSKSPLSYYFLFNILFKKTMPH